MAKWGDFVRSDVVNKRLYSVQFLSWPKETRRLPHHASPHMMLEFFCLKANDAQMPATSTKRQSDHLRVLVAEDSSLNQALAVRLLEKQGHTVTVVSNGKEAVQALDHAEFDLVLMDVEMPEMDGLSATRSIRASESRLGGRVPIVAVTSNDNREQCLGAGMDAYLPKPLNPDLLTRALDDVLNRVAA